MSIFDKISRRNDEAASRARERKRRYNELTDRLVSNIKNNQSASPEDAHFFKAALSFLKGKMRRYIEDRENDTPLGARACFLVSEDRMRAFTCVLPPEEGGEEITLDEFQRARHYEGIDCGILEENEQRIVQGRQYLRLIQIAQGKLPENGKAGIVSNMFKRCPVLTIDVPEEEEVDFGVEVPIQIVQKGAVLCKIQPSVPGKDGMDVMGNVLPCESVDDFTVLYGKNTSMSEDGRSLLADTDGIVFWDEDGWTVRKATVFEGNVVDKNIDIAGHLYVNGDVRDGASVTATGDIVIMGEVCGARVDSRNGSIRVIRGIKSDSQVKSKVQVQASVMSDSRVEAGEHVYAGVIEQCDVVSGGTICVGGEHGLILGGYVKAKDKIRCLKVGNMSGTNTRLAVGYKPELAKELEDVQPVLAEVQGTLGMLRKNISALRMAGNTLSQEKRKVLDQLVEQRKAYEQKEADLLKRQKTVQEELRKARSGSVSYRELWPVTEVRIGDKVGIFNSQEKNGNVHVFAGNVVVK